MASIRGTHGLVAYRYRGRYYTEMSRFDRDLDILGLRVIKEVPLEPTAYKKWLKDKREHYAMLEAQQDDGIFTMKADVDDDTDMTRRLWSETFRTQSMLRLHAMVVGSTIIVNLDAEVLTMQYSAHFNLADFPRRSAQWLNAIKPSIYQEYPTLSLDFCERKQMGEPAAARRAPKFLKDGTAATRVVPKSDLHSGRDVFLAHAIAKVFRTYHRSITRFGLEWERDSFVLRELVFAIVSIASGEADFSSAVCTRQYCFPGIEENDTGVHVDWQRPCFENGELGTLEPLATFDTFYHRKGQAPGAAPGQYLYWMKGVVINICTTVDGEAIEEAIVWGRKQGREAFQIIVMSIYQICFAEVHAGSDKRDVIRYSDPIHLSPLRAEECMALHPLARPQSTAEAGMSMTEGERVISCNSFGTSPRLKKHYPGLVALVNFFKVAVIRMAPPQSASTLPPEILARIMSYTDNETHGACMKASQTLCSFGFDELPLTDEYRIVSKPEVMRSRSNANTSPERGLLALRFVNKHDGKTCTMVQVTSTNGWGLRTWTPLIGHRERRVLMTDVFLTFTPSDDHERDEDGADSDVSYLECDDDSNY
ncbi:hypothetical protein NLG97_g4408 [Lecanicillium saksenae]|uniref:Uncharacterized protein n=1 Tax=Lecanicillium saksenae TaxID=468837 RepID=A0ACC1QYI5_9HYPO|nr:hypothetical protein NLG97_g4408 [Lecanicillium saksenae]